MSTTVTVALDPTNPSRGPSAARGASRGGRARGQSSTRGGTTQSSLPRPSSSSAATVSGTESISSLPKKTNNRSARGGAGRAGASDAADVAGRTRGGVARSRGAGRGRGAPRNPASLDQSISGSTGVDLAFTRDASESTPRLTPSSIHSSEAGAVPLPLPSAAAHSSRRTRFKSTLSSNSHLSAATASFLPNSDPSGLSSLAPATSTSTSQSPSLAERLAAELASGTADCPICFSSLAVNARIHSCSTCYTPFHLACVGKWADHACKESVERAAVVASRSGGAGSTAASFAAMSIASTGGEWRCPACQSSFGHALLPREYRCFCARVLNPSPPSAGARSLPHSCGKGCARQRKTCTHACAERCHPGPCKPCAIVVERGCFCGAKSGVKVRCSAAAAASSATEGGALSCGGICGKRKDCGVHACEEICHEGPCEGCVVVREKNCFCGRQEVVEGCGQVRVGEIVDCVGAEGEAWVGEWSCERVCDRTYDCGEHNCSLPCHPHPASSSCPFSPATLTTCPCTSTLLSSLLTVPRSSCLSPIPTCSELCPKLLDCGHPCSRPCHSGACGSCDERIVVVCRCAATKVVKRCGDRTPMTPLPPSASTSAAASTSATPTLASTRAAPMFISSVDLPPPADELRCTKVCRAMRSCGRHECGRKCCPLSYEEALRAKGGRRRAMKFGDEAEVEREDEEGVHACEKVCGRKLSCGNHTCERRDHKGPCGPCLRAGFEELICHCRSTVMMPPIACNARMDCRHPCVRQSSCGHPGVTHACHENEDGCPSCPFLTRKICACGKTTVANVRCSSDPKRVSCGLACGKLLRCGFHRCTSTCHAAGACTPCEQACLKPRRCSHPCPEDCHAPSACPFDTPCPKLITVSCACGTIQQQARCGAHDARPEGNADRVVKCTDACSVAKRNAALAEALGIEKEKREKKVRSVEYEPLVLEFVRENLTFCTNLEATLTEFMNSEKSAIHLPVMKRPQRQFAHELSAHFDLRSESLDEEPYRSVIVHRQSTSCTPTPTLTEALAALRKTGGGVLTFGSLRKVVPERVPNNAILLEGVGAWEQEALEGLLRGTMAGLGFKVNWVTEQDVLVSFDSPTIALSPSTFEQRITSIQSSMLSLRSETSFCSTIELVRLGEDGTIARGSWTSVSGSSTPMGAGSNGSWRNASTSGRIVSKNSFAALGTVVGSSALSGTAETWRSGSIVSGGLNRPPIAVIGSSSIDRPDPPPLSMPADVAPAREDEAMIPDDWEQVDEVGAENGVDLVVAGVEVQGEEVVE